MGTSQVCSMSLASGTLQLIFTTCIIENYLSRAFISAIIAYAVKPNPGSNPSDFFKNRLNQRFCRQENNIDMLVAEKKPGIITLLKCKCPRCRKGDMFENKNPYILKETMKMNKECPVCGQPLNIEVGFYYGSSYISYAVAVALAQQHV